MLEQSIRPQPLNRETPVIENQFHPSHSTGPQRVRKEIVIAGRTFITEYDTENEIVRGEIRPEPARISAISDSRSGIPPKTHLNYVIRRTDKPNQRGAIQMIETATEDLRQGWASDMVRALLTIFPTTYWNNESLNEQSGPFFMKMQAEFPDKIAAITHVGHGVYKLAPNPIPGG